MDFSAALQEFTQLSRLLRMKSLSHLNGALQHPGMSPGMFPLSLLNTGIEIPEEGGTPQIQSGGPKAPAIGTASGKLRVGVVCDLLQENWPSMDLVADMLLHELQARHAGYLQAVRLRPSYTGHWPGSTQGPMRFADTVQRAFNRYVKYPRWLQRQAAGFDLFHVVDHSYAHLVHSLPPGRAVVTCHDLDAFSCLLEPDSTRSWTFRQITTRVLAGLQKAAWVLCDTGATADELLAHGWITPKRISVVPLGVELVFNPAPDAIADQEADLLLNTLASGPKLLHVGSTIPRKRIDVLLRAVAEIKKSVPRAALVRVGGPFTREQVALVRQLELEDSIVSLPFLSNRVLAAVYRKCNLLLLSSEREGFGLPVLEAMACGLPVVASDIPALKEVGGNAVMYVEPGNVEGFAGAAIRLLRAQPAEIEQRRQNGIIQAGKFSWSKCADATVRIYEKVLAAAPARGRESAVSLR